MSAPVELVFRGEVLNGHAPDEVRRQMGRLLKLDDAQLAVLFSGRPAVLKRHLDDAAAHRYVAQLAALGVRVHPRPMAGPLPEATAVPSAVPPAAAPAVAPAALSLQPASAEEIECPNCGLRQPKAVFCRGCTTDIEMGLAARAEERERREAERLALLEERQARRRRAGEVRDPTATPAIGLGFQGRIGRMAYATANVWLITSLVLLTAGLFTSPSLGRLLLLGLGFAVTFFLSMRLAVLRCHDCDRHGWWSLLVLVPYVGTLVSLVLTFGRGNEDENDYGDPPPRGRPLWLFVALAVMALGLVIGGRAALRQVERQAEAAQQQQDEDGELEPFEPDGAPRASRGSFGSSEADAAFRDEYLPAADIRAFAINGRGAWGLSSGADDLREAARDALFQCQSRREAYTPDCQLVSVNGRPVRQH